MAEKQTKKKKTYFHGTVFYHHFLLEDQNLVEEDLHKLMIWNNRN